MNQVLALKTGTPPTNVLTKPIVMWKDPAEPISVVSRWKAAVVGDGKLPTTRSVVHDPESVNAPEENHPAGGPPGNASMIVIVTSTGPLAWAGPPSPAAPRSVIPATVEPAPLERIHLI
jgi:hypothetical protein